MNRHLVKIIKDYTKTGFSAYWILLSHSLSRLSYVSFIASFQANSPQTAT